jgi:WD40 repeat protein
VRLFALASRKTTRHLPWRGSLISLAWSPNGAVIACGTQESSVHFWRVASGRDSEMSGFPSKPRALAWSSDGNLLATGGDIAVTIWSFEGKGPEGKAPTVLVGHQALCTALAFHPKQPRLASGSDDTGVLVWDPRAIRTPVAFGFLDETVTVLAWTARGTLLIGADAVGTVRAWGVS